MGKFQPVINSEGYELVEFRVRPQVELTAHGLDAPLTSAFVLVRHQSCSLLVHNRRKSRWELPGGIIEPGETPTECAIRELLEETSQNARRLRFEGLMNLRFLPADRREYAALFSCRIQRMAGFLANDETDAVVLWDGKRDIGCIEEISRALIELYGGS